MSLLNSLALSVIVWLFLSFGNVRLSVQLAMFLLSLLLVLTIFNVYSRIVVERFSHMRPMAVDMSNVMNIWAARN